MTAALALWRFLSGNWWRTTAIGLALALAGMTFRTELLSARLSAERSAHNETKANYREAAALAEAAAQKAKADAEARYRQHAERTDREHQADLADANARAERFIAANRVRVQAAGGAPGGTPAAPGSGSAGGGDGPGEDSVVVGAEDVRICTENTQRLIAAREWGLSL